MRPLSLLWIALLLCAVNLSSQTTWTGNTSTDWFVATNWSSGLPSGANPATVPGMLSSGNFPTISTATTINYDVTSNGTVTIAAPVVLQSATFQNSGSGTIVVSSTGSLDVGASGVLSNFAQVDNSGIITVSTGTINHFAGTFNNFNSIINDADFVNFSGATLNNGSALGAGTITNNSNFTSGGDINNVNGIILNNSNFTLQASGSIDNDDEIKNNSVFLVGGGTLINDGIVSNCGTLTNDFGATFTNNGTLENALCAYIQHFTSNAITLGTVVNNGIAYAQGSDILIGSGTGEKFANAFTDFPAPSANCFSAITIQLSQAGNTQAMITPSDLDSASLAPYCGVETLAASQTIFSCSDLGINSVTLTVTDSLGFSNTCVTDVTVTDNQAPIVTFCPPSQTINLGPSLCGSVATFADVLGTDNCGNETVLKLDTTGLVSGDFFPVGVNNLMYAVTDGFLSDTCRFSITVNDFQSGNATLSCQSYGNLSVDLDCRSELHASMLLIGEYGCFDVFEAFIKETGETVITTAHVGQTITVMVRDPRTGNACWGNLLIEDKAGPAAMNCVNDTIYCMENPLPTIELGDVVSPMFQDCGNLNVTYYDEVNHYDCVGNYVRKINRNWLATDENNNVSRCVQEILVQTVDLTSVIPVCPTDFEEECIYNKDHSLDPEVTGYPTVSIGGKIFSLDNTADFICNIKATFRDDTLATSCGASLKIIRTWRIIDCCASNTVWWTCSQSVKLTDTTKPVIKTATVHYAEVDNNTTCAARPELPQAIVRDCSPYTVIIMTPSGIIDGNGGQVPPPGLNQGINIVTYLVTDECGNSETMDMTVIVEDNRPPVAVCKRFTTVAITSSGTGVLKAASLDNGSSDECCLDASTGFNIRRLEDACMMPLDTTFRPEILLCCEDAMDTLQVEMEVSDCAGNKNTCLVNVLVDNNLPPLLTCPPTATITCNDDPNNTARTGRIVTNPAQQGTRNGLAEDNCGSVTVDYMDDSANISCTSGFITRTWKATDNTGRTSTCNQIIHVQNTDPFDGTEDIIWPADTSILGCNTFPDTSVTGSPEINSDACDVIVINFTDDTLRTNINEDAVKILRRWVVIEECQYSLNDPLNPGLWEHTQVIELNDPDAPTIMNCNNKIFCNEQPNCQDLTVDLSIEVDDTCTPTDRLVVRWVVDANADGNPDSGPLFEGTGMNDNNAYPNGTHEICYEVIDGFNNRTSCCFLFKIIDCKKPTPICYNNSIALMATGMIPVNIMHLQNGASFDNCTAKPDLQFSYSSDVNDTVRTFTCLNLGINTLEVWLTDELGNQDFCTAELTVQDNMSACTNNSKIAIGGSTKNEEGEAVNDVQMTISGQGQATIKTNDLGEFMFTNIPAGHDYSLTPFKNDDLRNGVSTMDLVLISKHVLNVAKLDSPYKLIAADVNNSGSITTLDVVAARKVVLFVSSEFPGNASWRFIDKDHVFTNPQNPFTESFAEVVNLNNLTNDELKADFISVKIGDVNGDAIPNNLLGVEDRTFNEQLNLTLHNQTFEKGDFITVTFKLEENESLAGLQSTINFDPTVLQLEEVMEGLVNRENLGLTLLQNGAITLSWDNANNQTLSHEHTLFSLQFQTLAAGKLSEWLSLSSNYTTAEAYATDGNVYNLDLKFTEGDSTDELVLYQNKPNPFSTSTVIGFELPEASNVSLTIHDVSGKVVGLQNHFFSAGYNEFKVDKEMLNTSGVMYYRLDTPTASATKKMILLNSDN